uniref:WecB/TagA/CpsF family glycosyltransferase n=1 Tax=Candidatus Onthocola sp. TaxID=3085646 RepID=UPI003FED3E4A
MKKYITKLYKKSKESYYKILEKDLKNKNKKFIVTINPETLMIAEKDIELKEILEDDSVSFVPDGIGVVKAAKMIGVDVKERIPGIEIAEKLFEFANESKKSLYLFGAKQEVLNNLKEKIEKNYSNIKLLGMTNGYVENKEEEFQKIIKKEPDIVLVALGIPAQEKLIYKYFKDFKKGIFVGVGGSFDVLSGTKKRAPQIFIKTNTEWLYRILKEPKRIKRFWDNNVKFIFKIRKEKND